MRTSGVVPSAKAAEPVPGPAVVSRLLAEAASLLAADLADPEQEPGGPFQSFLGAYLERIVGFRDPQFDSQSVTSGA